MPENNFKRSFAVRACLVRFHCYLLTCIKLTKITALQETIFNAFSTLHFDCVVNCQRPTNVVSDTFVNLESILPAGREP